MKFFKLTVLIVLAMLISLIAAATVHADEAFAADMIAAAGGIDLDAMIAEDGKKDGIFRTRNSDILWKDVKFVLHDLNLI